MNDHKDHVCSDKGKPGQNYEYAILPCPETEVKNHLAEQTPMLKKGHEDEPVRDEEMLTLLLIANIG